MNRSLRTLLTTAALLSALLLASCVPPPPAWDVNDRLPTTWGTGRFAPAATNVAYAPSADHPNKRADVYLPVAGGNRGVIVFVHGGGYTSGSRSMLFDMNGPLTRQLERGFAIVNIDYRFDAFPAAVHDLSDAVAFVRSPAGAALGLNAAKIIVAGHSAGGTIAADLALAADRGNLAPFGHIQSVNGWISIAGPLDLTGIVDPMGSAQDAWRATNQPFASPLSNLDANDPPGLVIHGDSDGIVSVGHTWRFVESARRVGYTRYQLDIVEKAEADCRNHSPLCGASISGIDRFVDSV